MILFGGLLAVGAWGAPFFRGLQPHVGQAAAGRPGVGHGLRLAYSPRAVASSA